MNPYPFQLKSQYNDDDDDDNNNANFRYLIFSKYIKLAAITITGKLSGYGTRLKVYIQKQKITGK